MPITVIYQVEGQDKAETTPEGLLFRIGDPDWDYYTFLPQKLTEITLVVTDGWTIYVDTQSRVYEGISQTFGGTIEKGDTYTIEADKFPIPTTDTYQMLAFTLKKAGKADVSFMFKNWNLTYAPPKLEYTGANYINLLHGMGTITTEKGFNFTFNGAVETDYELSIVENKCPKAWGVKLTDDKKNISINTGNSITDTHPTGSYTLKLKAANAVNSCEFTVTIQVKDVKLEVYFFSWYEGEYVNSIDQPSYIEWQKKTGNKYYRKVNFQCSSGTFSGSTATKNTVLIKFSNSTQQDGWRTETIDKNGPHTKNLEACSRDWMSNYVPIGGEVTVYVDNLAPTLSGTTDDDQTLAWDDNALTVISGQSISLNISDLNPSLDNPEDVSNIKTVKYKFIQGTTKPEDGSSLTSEWTSLTTNSDKTQSATINSPNTPGDYYLGVEVIDNATNRTLKFQKMKVNPIEIEFLGYTKDANNKYITDYRFVPGMGSCELPFIFVKKGTTEIITDKIDMEWESAISDKDKTNIPDVSNLDITKSEDYTYTLNIPGNIFANVTNQNKHDCYFNLTMTCKDSKYRIVNNDQTDPATGNVIEGNSFTTQVYFLEPRFTRNFRPVNNYDNTSNISSGNYVFLMSQIKGMEYWASNNEGIDNSLPSPYGSNTQFIVVSDPTSNTSINKTWETEEVYKEQTFYIKHQYLTPANNTIEVKMTPRIDKTVPTLKAQILNGDNTPKDITWNHEKEMDYKIGQTIQYNVTDPNSDKKLASGIEWVCYRLLTEKLEPFNNTNPNYGGWSNIYRRATNSIEKIINLDRESTPSFSNVYDAKYLYVCIKDQAGNDQYFYQPINVITPINVKYKADNEENETDEFDFENIKYVQSFEISSANSKIYKVSLNNNNTETKLEEGAHTSLSAYAAQAGNATQATDWKTIIDSKTISLIVDATKPNISGVLGSYTLSWGDDALACTKTDKIELSVDDLNTELTTTTDVSDIKSVKYTIISGNTIPNDENGLTDNWTSVESTVFISKNTTTIEISLSDITTTGNHLLGVEVIDKAGNRTLKYQPLTFQSIPAEIPSSVTTLQIQHGQILDSALRNYVFYTDDTHTTKVAGKWEAKMYTETGVIKVTAAIPASEAGDSYQDVTYTFTPTDDDAVTYGPVSYTVAKTEIIKRKIYVSGMKDINVFSSATGNAEIEYTAVDDCGTDLKEYVVPKSDNGNLVIGSLPGYPNSRPVYILEIKDNAETDEPVSPAIADGTEEPMSQSYQNNYEIVAEEGKEIPSITVTASDVIVTYNNGGSNQKTTISGFKDIQYVNSLEISSPFTEHDVALGVDGQWDPENDSETHKSLSGLDEGRYSLDAISAWAHLNYTGSNPEWLKLENLGSANDILVYDHTKPMEPEIEITSQDIFEGDNDITFQISASDVVTDPSGKLPSCIRSITYWIDEDQATEISAGQSDPTSSEYKTDIITITADYLKALPEGTTHTIYAKAEDNAGNISDIARAYFYIPTDRDIEMERDTFVFTYQEPRLNITGIHNYGNPIKGAVIVAVDGNPTNESPYTWSIADGNCQWDNEQQSLVMDVPGTDVFKMRTGVYYTMNLVSARKTSPSFVVRRTWELSDDLVLDKDSALAATAPDGYCNQNPVNVEIMLKENYSLRPEGVVYIRHKDSTETHAYIMNENGLFRITDGEEFKGFTFNADEDKMPEGTNMYELIFADDELQNDPNLSEPVNMRAKMKVASGKIQKLYEDVLYVNNSLGLYRDNEYQWYQDEEEIMNWNNQFIELSQSYEELSGQNVKIYANVIMDKTGEKVESCQAPSNSKIISYGEVSLMKRAPAPSISAYPNPAKAFAAITIKLTNVSESRLDKCSIQIHNQMGAMVKTITNIRESNTTALPSGIYTISLINNGKITKSTKIIVE